MSHAVRTLAALLVAAASLLVAADVTQAQEELSGNVLEVPALRLAEDLRSLESVRPGYTFWRHVFTVPDGSVAFGSAADGRLLAVLPSKGNWAADGRWIESSLASVAAGAEFPADLDGRRIRLAELLEPAVGRVQHNPTRGAFVAPSAARYGRFLAEWGSIYERFGVPAEIGLAQALIESGFDGTRRSPARAIGFCQWLQSNWKRLDRLSDAVLESRNQTTQAPYCAAHLAILATKYKSFIPALSDHHSGGANVGRVLINGRRLGGADVRDMYLLGSQFARDLRQIDLYGYRDNYRTYGPRSYLYAEMVFGNMLNVRDMTAATHQVPIYAMRTRRALRLVDITARTGLSADEVRRYNPALTKQVPPNADLYLPKYVKDFGEDVSFWHRSPNAAFTEALRDFQRIDVAPERWDDPQFMPVLRRFEQRFRATKTAEGAVMATMLTFAIEDAETSGRREMLTAFEASAEIRQLFERALLQRVTTNLATLACAEGQALVDADRSAC